MAPSLPGRLTAALLLSLLFAAPSYAVKPAASLLPNTTKAYVSVPDVNALKEHWNETQLGILFNDPVMQPFLEDLRRQIRDKLSQTGDRLGLTWDDVDEVYGGEVSFALVQPWDAAAAQERLQSALATAEQKAKAAGKKPDEISAARETARKETQKALDKERGLQCAVVVLVDVTGHGDAAQELLAKIDRNMIERKATREALTLGGAPVTAYTLPKKKDETAPRHAYYCLLQDQLITTDRQEVALEVIGRMTAAKPNSLQEFEPFMAAAKNSQVAFGEVQSHLTWFMEPFGYSEVMRVYNGGKKRPGTDLLKVLQNQGFTAIQGIGGAVSFKTADHDIRYHTLVYAPPVQRAAAAATAAKKDEPLTKYDLAARMLEFPNSQQLQPLAWIPRGLGTHLTLNWKMEDAFWYARSLVNEVAGDDVFDDVIANLEVDPHGPRINVKEEFTKHLGERATLISDYRLPIGPKSERVLVAIQVKDPATVMATVNKAMENDPAAKKREHNGHVIWEMLKEDVAVEDLKIEGFDSNFGFDEPVEKPKDKEKPFMPNSAISVAHGHLLLASHVDYIVDILQPPAGEDTLMVAAEYQAVDLALKDLGAGSDSFRMFTRTDEAYRVTYELLRQGKMPESESLLGRFLNRVFATEDDDKPREQQLDGTKLPEFQVVRRYLGPSGFYVRTVDQGWEVTGCLLSKVDQQPEVAAVPTETTAE